MFANQITKLSGRARLAGATLARTRALERHTRVRGSSPDMWDTEALSPWIAAERL
jgi:hypothetical protein